VSATRLLVLGVVKLAGQAHGYQVRRELLEWGADRWANCQPGSIYHALKKAARDGMLEAVGETSEVGPDRTCYRLTALGEEEFSHLLRQALTDPDPKNQTVAAALSFLPLLSRDEAIRLLGFRIRMLESEVTGLRSVGTALPMAGRPEHVVEHFHYWIALREAEIRWAQDLVDRLANGTYTMAGEAGAWGRAADGS